MKKLILTSFLILFAATLPAQDTKFTAAVMDLTTEQGVSASVSRMLSDYLRTQLFNTQKFTLVTRENMEQILKEQQFQLSGCTSQECIVQAGQLLGVRKMFTGSIGKLGTTYLISLKIIDIQSGQIERAETEKCDKCEEQVLLTSIENLARKLTGLEFVKKEEAEIAALQKELREKEIILSEAEKKKRQKEIDEKITSLQKKIRGEKEQKPESAREEVTKPSLEIDSYGLIEDKTFFPNPFSPNNDGKCDTTALYIFSVKGESITVRIYTLKGNLIRTLVGKKVYYDTAQIPWDGTDENNKPSPVGVYVYQLKVGDKISSGTVVLTR